MILKAFFFISCSCIFICTVSGQCTLEADIYPCTCDFNGIETSLVCSDVTRQAEIDRLSNQTEDFQFDNFVLKNATVSSIPQQLMLDKSISSLIILKSHLKSLFKPILRYVSDLDAVRIEKVSFSNGLYWSHFQNLENVKSVRFRQVNIPSLDENFQKCMSKNLVILELTKTNTSFIADNAFSAMGDLTDIRIQNNRISQLKRSMFPSFNSIQTFFFNDNLIENLPDDLFYEMPHLLRVGFENNKISFLSQNLFDRFYHQLMVLALKGNPIKCGCSLKWIANRNKHNHDKYITGVCVSPKDLARKEIFELSDADFSYCQ